MPEAPVHIHGRGHRRRRKFNAKLVAITGALLAIPVAAIVMAGPWDDDPGTFVITTPEEQSRQRYESALRAERPDERDRRLRELIAEIAARPNPNARTRMIQARAHRALGEFLQAYTVAGKAVDTDPSDVDVRTERYWCDVAAHDLLRAGTGDAVAPATRQEDLKVLRDPPRGPLGDALERFRARREPLTFDDPALGPAERQVVAALVAAARGEQPPDVALPEAERELLNASLAKLRP
jgi:hypothetical protein